MVTKPLTRRVPSASSKRQTAPSSIHLWYASAGVSVAVSTDGQKFTDFVDAEFPMYNFSSMEVRRRDDARAKIDVKGVKYIKVKVGNVGKLPEWHPYAGENAWIMIDEITIK